MNTVQRATRHTLSIWLLVLAFTALASAYSIVTPIFEASDEIWHYPVVQYLAAGRGLPVQTPPDRPGLWKQEASQAPLYYMVAALLTSWVDTSDLSATLRPNPHAAIGTVSPDGNINMAAHDPAREAWPWRGAVLAVHLARLLSVACSAATIYLTHRLSLAVLPNRADVALGAAAFVAFTPMFVFVSGSVNNDNLATPLCTLAVLLMIRQCQAAHDDEKRLLRGWAVLGIVCGLAILSKSSALLLLPLAALAGAWVAVQHGFAASPTSQWAGKLALRRLFLAGLAIGLPVLSISGWWFVRNLQLYGDWLGFKYFTPYFTRPVPADLAQIWSERNSFLYGYWGNFGGLNLPLPAWAFAALNGLLILSALGLVLALIRFVTRQTSNVKRHSSFSLPPSSFLLLLWGLGVWLGWLSWTRTTWSSQGRLVFYALPAYAIGIAAGLSAWLPRRVAPPALGVVGGGMALLAAAIPFTVIAPAYARPPQLTPAQITAIQQRTDVTFGESLVLLGYDAPAASALPGDTLPITLYWQALKPLERDCSVFVHLLDESDVETQDKGPAYPGRGNLPTTTLTPGQTWAETWAVPIRATAYAPARLTWEVGLFDAQTGARLQAADRAKRALGDNLRFGQIELARPANSPYNPVSFNLGDQMELIGFDLDRRAARPGETVRLTLTWRAVTQPARDYTAFVQVLNSQQHKAAALDTQPAPPTSRWQPGQVISQTYSLEIKPSPPGVYDIWVGAYYFTDGSNIERLKVVTRDGRLQQDVIVLGRLRVTE